MTLESLSQNIYEKLENLKKNYTLSKLKKATRYCAEFFHLLSELVKNNKDKIHKDLQSQKKELMLVIKTLNDLIDKICSATDDERDIGSIILSLEKTINKLKIDIKKNESIKEFLTDLANAFEDVSQLLDLAHKSIEDTGILLNILGLIKKLLSFIHPLLLHLKAIEVQLNKQDSKVLLELFSGMEDQDLNKKITKKTEEPGLNRR